MSLLMLQTHAFSVPLSSIHVAYSPFDDMIKPLSLNREIPKFRSYINDSAVVLGGFRLQIVTLIRPSRI
jgi:hypothetical protein